MEPRSLIYSIPRAVARLLFSAFYRIATRREEPLPLRGPTVILPKHQYWTDIPLVSLTTSRPLFFVAKQELFRHRGLRFYLKSLGGIPIDREQPIRTLQSIRDLLSRLKGLEPMVIFPEGTYFRGVVGPGKSRLVQTILGYQSELGRRISFIPLGIRYGERRRWRREVSISIGRPLFAEKESDAVHLTEQVMKEISRLSGLPQAGAT